MNYKIIIAIFLFIGFTISAQAQIVISSGDELIKELEKKAERQLAAEKADPTLSKNRPGRISTKEEKKEMKKSRKARQQELVKALKMMPDKKIKIQTSKNQPPRPTKGTIKKIKE